MLVCVEIRNIGFCLLTAASLILANPVNAQEAVDPECDPIFTNEFAAVSDEVAKTKDWHLHVEEFGTGLKDLYGKTCDPKVFRELFERAGWEFSSERSPLPHEENPQYSWQMIFDYPRKTRLGKMWHDRARAQTVIRFQDDELVLAIIGPYK